MKTEQPEYNRREDDRRIRALQAVNVCFSRIYHRLTVLNRPVLPKHGPAILVCNHTSSLDPLLIQSVCPRLIRWIMAREYFDYKALRWFFNSVGVILVDRAGRDSAATRAAIRVLEQGYVLGVFPEGKIETSREFLPFQNGIGLLALRTGAPVFPAYLDGSQRGREMVAGFFVPCKATIAFGPQVQLHGLPTGRGGVQLATERIQNAVKNLQHP